MDGLTEKAVKELGAAFGKQIEALEAQMKENGKPSEDLVNQVKGLTSQLSGLSEDVKQMALKQNRNLTPNEGQVKSLKETFKETILELKEKGFGQHMNYNSSVDLKGGQDAISLKAADVITTSNLDGYASRDTRTNVIAPLQPRVRMRNIIRSVGFNAPIIEVPVEKSFEGGAGFQDEGAAKPTMDLDLEFMTVTPRTLAVTATTTLQAIEDIDYLSTYLARRMYDEWYNKEDFEILRGTGVGQSFTGLITAGDSYTPYGSAIVNGYDKLVDAISQLMAKNLYPNQILLNPLDYGELLINKDKDDAYTHPALVFDNSGASIYGVRITTIPQVPAGTAIVADFNHVELAVRSGLRFDVSYSHANNFVENKVTYRLEGRENLIIYRPEAILVVPIGTALPS